MSNGFYPKAIVKNIPPGSNDPPIKPRVAILHVDAGDNHSLYNYFNGPSGGIESHFHVRKDGKVEQYRSIYYQADANYKANDFAVSIETQGYGSGSWNAAQMAAIKELLLWLNKEAGIPLRKANAWNGSGVGYHILFGSPGHWTPVAKSCPGPRRINQFNNVLVPWMNNPRPVEEEDDLAAYDKEINELLEGQKRIERKVENKVERANKKLKRVNAKLKRVNANLRKDNADMAEIRTMLEEAEKDSSEETA